MGHGRDPDRNPRSHKVRSSEVAISSTPTPASPKFPYQIRGTSFLFSQPHFSSLPSSHELATTNDQNSSHPPPQSHLSSAIIYVPLRHLHFSPQPPTTHHPPPIPLSPKACPLPSGNPSPTYRTSFNSHPIPNPPPPITPTPLTLSTTACQCPENPLNPQQV